MQFFYLPGTCYYLPEDPSSSRSRVPHSCSLLVKEACTPPLAGTLLDYDRVSSSFSSKCHDRGTRPSRATGRRAFSLYTLLKVEAPTGIAIEEIRVPAKEDWKANLSISRRLGGEWLRSENTALARVPSAILPNTFNYLLNPLHRDAKKIRIANATRAVYDPRLLRHLRSG